MDKTKYVPREALSQRFFEAMPEPVKGFLFLTGCLTTLIIGVLLLPFIPLAIWRKRRLQRWFIGHLKGQGRVMSWTGFLERTRKGGGSIVIEVGNKAETKFWWVEERVLSLAPVAPVPISEAGIIVYGGGKYTPFARWCYERYLSPVDGTAVLAFPVEADFETFPFSEAFIQEMRDRFSEQEVAIVPFYDARYV